MTLSWFSENLKYFYERIWEFSTELWVLYMCGTKEIFIVVVHFQDERKTAETFSSQAMHLSRLIKVQQHNLQVKKYVNFFPPKEITGGVDNWTNKLYQIFKWVLKSLQLNFFYSFFFFTSMQIRSLHFNLKEVFFSPRAITLICYGRFYSYLNCSIYICIRNRFHKASHAEHSIDTNWQIEVNHLITWLQIPVEQNLEEKKNFLETLSDNFFLLYLKVNNFRHLSVVPFASWHDGKFELWSHFLFLFVI